MRTKIIERSVPDVYVPTIYDVDYENIYNFGIKYVIFDVDDTLLPSDDIDVTPELIELFDILKNDYCFKTCLVSDGSNRRVKPVADILETPYVAKAYKPTPYAYPFVRKAFDENNTASNTVFIGDSVFLDMIFAGRYGMYKVLVDSIGLNKYNYKTVSNNFVQAILSIPLKSYGFEFGKHYTKKITHRYPHQY